MTEIDDQKEQQRGKEDRPEYRSMTIEYSTIQPLAAPNTRRLFSPLEKVNKSIETFDHSYSKSEDEITRQSSSSYKWELQELTELPVDYILVRTNVYVKVSSSQIVADRICNALKTLSIVIDSKSFEEENSLLVETQHGIKLLIALFGCNDMTVVEVRRQSGCSIQFRDAAKAILRSSKGLAGKQQRSVATRKFCIPPTLPRRTLKAHQECIREDFQIAYTMLHSKKADAHLLALETMGRMTTSSEANDVAAKLVLSNYDCVKQMLFLLDFYKDRSIPEMKPSYRSSTVCRKVLEILANSCEAISKTDLAGILSTNDHDLKTRSFICFLMSFLDEASTRPHDAFQAARCMRSLLISEEVENLLVEMSAIDVISTARSVGLSFHLELEQESNKLMGQLQNAC